MSLSDLTQEAVEKAIAEFDHLGRKAFLKKYGFSAARTYVLQIDNRSYDSKAIAGAAHGYLPGHTALRSGKFSGGESTVQAKLIQLGFTVIKTDEDTLPTPGEILSNSQIRTKFVVGTQGGMRRSTARNLLVVISDPFKGLYQDRWEGDVLHYTGMGLTGEQSLTYAQNRTLAESSQTKIPVHLFEALEPMKYSYAGEVELADAPYQEKQLDEKGKLRTVWMFPLRLKEGGVIPALSDAQARLIEDEHEKIARRFSDAELKARAKASKAKPAVRNATTNVYVRDAAVSEYAKRSADGVCDLCEKPAPFSNKHSEPYLECHHIIWLAKGGPDTIENTVALCPNCHRKMHVLNHKGDKEKLLNRASQRTL